MTEPETTDCAHAVTSQVHNVPGVGLEIVRESSAVVVVGFVPQVTAEVHADVAGWILTVEDPLEDCAVVNDTVADVTVAAAGTLSKATRSNTIADAFATGRVADCPYITDGFADWMLYAVIGRLGSVTAACPSLRGRASCR